MSGEHRRRTIRSACSRRESRRAPSTRRPWSRWKRALRRQQSSLSRSGPPTKRRGRIWSPPVRKRSPSFSAAGPRLCLDFSNRVRHQDVSDVKIKAAVLHKMGVALPYEKSKPLAIEEVELDDPGHGEVLVAIAA